VSGQQEGKTREDRIGGDKQQRQKKSLGSPRRETAELEKKSTHRKAVCSSCEKKGLWRGVLNSMGRTRCLSKETENLGRTNFAPQMRSLGHHSGENVRNSRQARIQASAGRQGISTQ